MRSIWNRFFIYFVCPIFSFWVVDFVFTFVLHSDFFLCWFRILFMLGELHLPIPPRFVRGFALSPSTRSFMGLPRCFWNEKNRELENPSQNIAQKSENWFFIPIRTVRNILVKNKMKTALFKGRGLHVVMGTGP